MCEVKQSLISGAGRGVFTTKDFQKGDAICIYDGKYTSDRKRLTEDETIYAMGFGNGLILVGYKNPRTPQGVGQLINDCANISLKNLPNSDNSAFDDVRLIFDLYKRYLITTQLYSNVLVKHTPSPNIARVIATRDIKAGSELYLSYTINYWNNLILSEFRRQGYCSEMNEQLQSAMYAYHIYMNEIGKKIQHNIENNKEQYDKHMKLLGYLYSDELLHTYFEKPDIDTKIMRENGFVAAANLPEYDAKHETKNRLSKGWKN